MVSRRFIVFLLCALPWMGVAQEVLLPLQVAPGGERRPVKASVAAVGLPFFDDFAAGISPLMWHAEGGATWGADVSPLAPTVGMATLDAMNGQGELYPHASTALFPADTLTSVPLRIDSLSAADSVVLSFYYLPGGGYGNMWQRMGDTPNGQDTLFLDFFRAADSTWVNVWSQEGVSVDTLMQQTGRAWQYVAMPIADEQWFDSAFRFRFRNYASLESAPKAGRAGNCDYWHLDYVMVDRGRDPAAEAFRDVAFAAPAPSLLRDYRAMPYRQYTAAAMAQTLDMKITNLYSSPLATQYVYRVLDSSGTELHRYDGGFENAPAGEYQSAAMHATPAVTYAFPTMTAPAEYTVEHVVREGTAGDAHPANDTVRYCQRFADYFAYDDGTAENGYGLTSTAATLYLAYRFDLQREDTLSAVDMWFNRTLADGNAAVGFYLSVWSVDAEGQPGELLYRDEQRRFPAFGGFHRYVLEQAVVVEGQVFVGFEQSGSDFINLGFDRSLNTADRIWYLTGTEWQQSILSGSLMLRPCFGAAAAVGIRPVAELHPTVYPNPASDWLQIDGVAVDTRLTLYDVQGRTVATGTGRSLDVASLPGGLYLLRAVEPGGRAATARVIIKH